MMPPQLPLSDLNKGELQTFFPLYIFYESVSSIVLGSRLQDHWLYALHLSQDANFKLRTRTPALEADEDNDDDEVPELVAPEEDEPTFCCYRCRTCYPDHVSAKM
ncbi:hypothetical protein C8R47DRAFT_1229340 [Mycena vitilis]|nr:hypothetical protein C8R47DRAFT_1229340 [Mycena vitilis]